MMENRSFDNVLGWLYDEHNPPAAFRGCGAHPLSPLHQALVKAADGFVRPHTGESLTLEQLQLIQTTDQAVEHFERKEAEVRLKMELTEVRR